MMRHARLFILTRFCVSIAIALFVLGIITPVTFAAESLCDCFCQTEVGAKDIGKKTFKDCTDTCKKSTNTEPAVCAFNLDQYPSKNIRCFTEDLCQLQNGILDQKQTPECIAGERYCYPDPSKLEKVKLNVAIGSLTLAGDLAEYINVVYKWMLGAGVTIAIVMAMIGGLQYVLAAGSGDVSKGKERITNAMVGIVLLAAVYLILNSVNPYLVRLQPPKLPMVKQVNLVKGGSCEEIEKNGYVTEPAGEKKCGGSAKVKTDQTGKAIADGTTCDYKKCPTDTSCLGKGTQAKCVKCGDLIEGNAFNIIPSSTTCSQLSKGDASFTSGGKKYEQFHRCGWSKDANVNPGVGLFKFASQGSCVNINFYCSDIKNCTDYDSKPKLSNEHNAGGFLELDDITDAGASDFIDLGICNGNCGDFSLKTICEEDPCHLNGTKSSSGKTVKCVMDGKDDCETKLE